MDFFQFLQKSTDDDDSKKSKRKNKSTHKHQTEDFNVPCRTDNVLKETQKREMEQAHLYIKRGDMVRIVNVPNSMLNIYKGYIGEIKDYKIDQDSVLVFLHGITSVTFIKFPLVHLIKIP
jgi:hypothetical protein